MLRWVALVLTVATGFSGLVYEVTWQRYLATLLGSHNEATASVLGIFLGGLAVGYWLFGRVTRAHIARAHARGREPRLLLLYGLIEASIGAWALLFPAFFGFVQPLSMSLSSEWAALAFATDVAFAALLIAPPTILMGGTIPILTQALSRSLDDATRFHAFVYGFNTAGSFFGALAASFWLIPALGLVSTMVAMAIVNLSAGGIFVVIGLFDETVVERAAAGADEPVKRVPGHLAFASVALLSGFAMMVIQTSLIRLSGLSFGSTEHAFSMIVAVFVFCIAIGSFAVSAFSSIPPFLLVLNLCASFVAFAVLYLQLDDSPYWAHVVRASFDTRPESLYPYYLRVFLTTSAVIGLPILLSGATLPLIFHGLRSRSGDLGTVAGELYSWNTVGSLLGAFFGGYILLHVVDLHAVFRIALTALALGAGIAAAATLRDRPRYPVALAVDAVIGVWLMPAWSPYKLQSGLYRVREAQYFTGKGPSAFFDRPRNFELIFYDDDPDASVSVIENRAANGEIERGIAMNGKGEGTTITTYPLLGLTALVPAVLAEKLESAFVVGLGVGVTVGELAALETTQRIVVAEIARSAIDAAPLFDEWTQQASKNPKIRAVASDAYRTLLRSRGDFDVIISQPSSAWSAGTERLYSVEFLELARRKLASGGIYIQWFHTFESSDEVAEMTIRTFDSVFDDMAIWYGDSADLLMIGIQNPESAVDLERLEARYRRPDIRAGLKRCGVHSFPELLAHEILPVGVISASHLTGPLQTLMRPRLNELAARAFFTGEQAELPFTGGPQAAAVGRKNSLVRQLASRYGGALPPRISRAITAKTCELRPRECAPWLGYLTAEARNEVHADTPLDQKRTNLLRRAQAAYGSLPVDDLSHLFLESSDDVPQGGSLSLAKRASGQFVHYYHHAIPFSSEALARVWNACLLDECAAERRRTEALLGPLQGESSVLP